MAPRSRIRTQTAAWIGGMTAVASLAAWAYWSLSKQEETDDTLSPNTKPAISASSIPKRTGTKPSLTLSTSILPPPWFLTLLSSSYTVHLLLPSTIPFLLPPKYHASFDQRRLLFHEKGEGVVHVSRALRGILVVVAQEGDGQGLEGMTVADLQAEGGTEVEEGSIQKSDNSSGIVEIGLQRLVTETRSFVAHLVVVVPEGGQAEANKRLGVEASKVKIVEGWKELGRVLGV